MGMKCYWLKIYLHLSKTASRIKLYSINNLNRQNNTLIEFSRTTINQNMNNKLK